MAKLDLRRAWDRLKLLGRLPAPEELPEFSDEARDARRAMYGAGGNASDVVQHAEASADVRLAEGFDLYYANDDVDEKRE